MDDLKNSHHLKLAHEPTSAGLYMHTRRTVKRQRPKRMHMLAPLAPTALGRRLPLLLFCAGAISHSLLNTAFGKQSRREETKLLLLVLGALVAVIGAGLDQCLAPALALLRSLRSARLRALSTRSSSSASSLPYSTTAACSTWYRRNIIIGLKCGFRGLDLVTCGRRDSTPSDRRKCFLAFVFTICDQRCGSRALHATQTRTP